ncbi:uncharacterized protein LOC119689465 [Teleopsis dalmanni]|uniref:uncharacterized protein LOC119689465 n=1 Tax=Teleopsis dalmanni TaxID=139649 RepID=UPI0018CE35D8|nr:uncharacterized protein LOC119689465 [Teleopsis dalmanni]
MDFSDLAIDRLPIEIVEMVFSRGQFWLLLRNLPPDTPKSDVIIIITGTEDPNVRELYIFYKRSNFPIIVENELCYQWEVESFHRINEYKDSAVHDTMACLTEEEIHQIALKLAIEPKLGVCAKVMKYMTQNVVIPVAEAVVNLWSMLTG